MNGADATMEKKSGTTAAGAPSSGALPGFPLYSLKNLCKEYEGPGEQVRVLQAVSLDIQEGETIAVVGASGSGKSTLLHVLGALARPTSGALFFCGKDMTAMTPERMAAFRNTELGFVFQFHHLLPEFTTLENVAMQALVGGMGRKEALRSARAVLDKVGLSSRADFSVTALSGGERQRAAIARAIVLKPKVLLADEPTGNLDEKNGGRVADLLQELNVDEAMSMVVVTHNPELAGRMGRCFELKSGELYEKTR